MDDSLFERIPCPAPSITTLVVLVQTSESVLEIPVIPQHCNMENVCNLERLCNLDVFWMPIYKNKLCLNCCCKCTNYPNFKILPTGTYLQQNVPLMFIKSKMKILHFSCKSFVTPLATQTYQKGQHFQESISKQAGMRQCQTPIQDFLK